jgi:subtilisin family serine protease
VTADFAAKELRLTRRYELLAGFAASARVQALPRLASHPDVARVALDLRGVFQLQEGVPLVGGTDAASHGYDGAGVTVAVLDSGVDVTHVDLADSIVGEECFCFRCCPDGSDRQSGPGSVVDTEGHGTAVAGIITANGTLVGPGVAPNADIFVIKVGSAAGSVTVSDLAAALDWLAANATSLGVDVVNASINFPAVPLNDESVCAGVNNVANAIAAVRAAGVAVFNSAGNQGWDSGVAFPACVPEAISVGAVYDGSFGSLSWPLSGGTCQDADTQPDGFACFSNSGAPLDLLAPGWQTRTTAPGGVNSGFGGTSAAAPYATGQAALLLQADPSLSPDQIQAVMTGNGPMVTRGSSGESFRRADVSLALTAVMPEPNPIPLLGPVPRLLVAFFLGLLALGGSSVAASARRSGRAKP